MSPGGLRGLQIRWGAADPSPVGSTPMRSRQIFVIRIKREQKNGKNKQLFFRSRHVLVTGILKEKTAK